MEQLINTKRASKPLDVSSNSDDSGDLTLAASIGNARYSLLKKTGRIASGLKGRELRCLGIHGFIEPKDKIQKLGQKTWHDARDVLGLLPQLVSDENEIPIVVTEQSSKELRKSKSLEEVIIKNDPRKGVRVNPNDNIVFKTVKKICNAHIDEKKATTVSTILRNRSLLAAAYETLTKQQFRNTWFQMGIDSQILLLNSIRISDTSREMSKKRKQAASKLARNPGLMKIDFTLFRRIAHAKDGLKTLNPNFKTEYGRSWSVYVEEF